MSLYYECHITIEPVFGGDLDVVQDLIKPFGFKVADLLMQKREDDTPERSKNDTFCTARHKKQEVLESKMLQAINALQNLHFKVWRYKIEDCVFDSKYSDVLGLLDE